MKFNWLSNFSRIQFLFKNKVILKKLINIPLYRLNRKMETMVSPYRREHKFKHYRQQHEWDCGLSCIIMILSDRQKGYFLQNFDEICNEEGFGFSTWTIDLCYILKRFNIRHVYLTKTIGVDPSYSEHNYYRNIILKDEQRVNKRFRNAESNGITVHKRTIDFNSFIKHLSIDGPIILLTNSTLLHCDVCDHQGQHCENDDEMINGENISYTGHYVLLVGYDLYRNKILYRNPAKENHLCSTSMQCMDKARTAFGTDEDVILIFL